MTTNEDNKYKIIGRHLYQEYLSLDKNLRFHTFIVDSEVNTELETAAIKYMWLLRQIESNQNQRIFQKPVHIFDRQKTELYLKLIIEKI